MVDEIINLENTDIENGGFVVSAPRFPEARIIIGKPLQYFNPFLCGSGRIYYSKCK